MLRSAVLLAAFAVTSSVFAQTSAPKSAACKACETKPKIAGKRDACAVPMTLSLSGLHCEGCAASVTKQLMAVKGVEEAKVSAKDQQAVVWVCPSKNVKPAALTAAVTKAGYKVVKIAKGEPKVIKTVKG